MLELARMGVDLQILVTIYSRASYHFKERKMPKFIDYHASLPPMPPEMMEQAKSQIIAGHPNEFGGKGLNLFLGTGGQAYCLSEAPNAEAVAKGHEALGIPINREDIIEVQSLV